MRTFLCSVLLPLGAAVLLACGTWLAGEQANTMAQGSLDDPPELTLGAAIEGFDRPVHITHAGDGSERIFVVEQEGRIRVVQDGTLLAALFLDIEARVGCCGERGLLSVAFPPQYATKNYFYVNYTNLDGNTVIARYRVTGDNPNQADPASEEILLTIDQPERNHNGGQLAFGPDGYLYIGMGDGGSAGDPLNAGQTTDTLLGKLLRIDTESDAQPYAVPPTNPFTQTTGYAAEIWALGLRNPWRFSFDSTTGDLYIGDVGQGLWEEISYQPASSSGGENYGWRCKEGTNDFTMDEACAELDLTPPVFEYDHSGGSCSVTGGHVYRGERYPRMQGLYFFGDYCSGLIWAMQRTGDTWQVAMLLDSGLGGGLTSFGRDEAGNLYVTDLNDDAIRELIDASPAAPTPTATATPEPLAPTATPAPNAFSYRVYSPVVVR